MIRWRTFGRAVAPAIALAALFLTGASPRLPAPGSGNTWTVYSEVTEQLQAIGFNDQTKFYAAPNGHLVWTFYTGLPIQSIGPIRQEYLNSYLGDIVYIDWFSEDHEVLLSADRIREAAQRNGCSISNDSAEQWSRLLLMHDYREHVEGYSRFPGNTTGTGAGIQQKTPQRQPRTRPQGVWRQRLELVARGSGFEVRNWRDWRKAFPYRLSDNPAFPYNSPANYAERAAPLGCGDSRGFKFRDLSLSLAPTRE